MIGGFCMSRQKGKKNTPQEVIDEIVRLHNAEGYSLRQLSEKYGMPFKTIGNMITRENNKKRKAANSKIAHRSGRPRTRPITTEEELKLRVNQLEREIELYRSFLQVVGRM